jgi:nucleoside-diphosphate-sugar epimerase
LHEDDIDLDDVKSPDATYGWVKLTGEQLARHANNEGIPVTVLRPFSGYGTDQALDYPFPAIIDRVKRREDPLIVWGDGLQTRDWVHISDIVGMTMAAIEADVTGPLNIGTGVPTSFLEFAQTAADIAGYNPVIEGRSDMPTGVDWRVADTSRSHPFYVPKIQLKEGIRMALEDRDG